MEAVSFQRSIKKKSGGNKSQSMTNYTLVPFKTILMFAGYILIWYLQVGVRIQALGAIRIELVWAIVLIALILLSKNASYPKNPLTKYILFLLITMATSLLYSCDFAVSWNIFFNRVVKFSFMGLFIACFLKSPRDFKIFLVVFLIACGKLTQEGVHGQISGTLVWENQGIMRLHGPTPLYEHPNSFSGMALGTIPFIIYLWNIVNIYKKILLFLLFLGSFCVVLFTGSRTGYLSFFMLLLVAIYRSRKKMKLLFFGSIISILILTVIPQQYIGRFQSTFSSYKNENTSAGKRLQILKDAIVIFKDYPFGVGVGAFPIIRERTFGRIQDTHNLYLEILTNIGIHGFFAFLLFILNLFILLRRLEIDFHNQLNYLRKRLKKSVDPLVSSHIQDIELMQAVTRAIILFICIRLSLGVFGMDLYEIYWWFASGTTIALYHVNEVMTQKTNYLISNTREIDYQ